MSTMAPVEKSDGGGEPRLPERVRMLLSIQAEPRIISIFAPDVGTLARWQWDVPGMAAPALNFDLRGKPVSALVETNPATGEATKLTLKSEGIEGSIDIPPGGKVDCWSRLRPAVSFTFSELPDYQ